MSDRIVPGQVLFGEGDLTLNHGRESVELEVTNTGDRAIQVGSHYHFFEVNKALRFERERTFAMRLDIPSGTAVRFEAGQTHQVALVPYGGLRKVVGFNGLADGADFEQAMERGTERGFVAGEPG